jgi:uncharacterized protein YbaR (Trm112 family)
MKSFLLPHLICPACLPKEFPLDLSRHREENDDIITGTLSCRKCKRHYPIREGMALLLRDSGTGSSGGQVRYDEAGMLGRYLWSHYADLCGIDEVGDACTLWPDCFVGNAVSAFDAGCAVGRFTFEMAARSRWAVGCDLSTNFIRAARNLARDRSIAFSLPLEGNLRETFQCTIPASWQTDTVEFVVADAQAIPFGRGSFQQITSLNLIDRVNYPLAHLYEMNRIARVNDAAFLFADPFSWSISATPEERWLGGTSSGQFAGRGIDTVRALLGGKDKVIDPPWQIKHAGAATWRMRSHRNHCELIRSEYLSAIR